MIFLCFISDKSVEGEFQNKSFAIEEGGVVLFILWLVYILSSKYSQITGIDVSAKEEQIFIPEYLNLLINRNFKKDSS